MKQVPTTILSHLLGLGILIIPISFGFTLPYPFHTAKWFALFVIASLTGVALLFSKPLNVSKPALIIVSGFSFLYFLSMFLHWPGLFESQILEFSSLFLVGLGSFTYFSREKNKLSFLQYNLPALGIVLAYSYYQEFNTDWILYKNMMGRPVSFFGNINLAAEYIGLSLLIELFFVFSRDTRLWSRFFRISVVVAGFYILLNLQSRTAWLALGAGTVFLLHSGFFREKRKWFFTFSAAIVLLITFAGVRLYQNTQAWGPKVDSTRTRAIRLMNTWEMVKDHPWFGVGHGQYETEYVKYKSAWRSGYPDPEVKKGGVVESPHNSFLNAAAEYGIPLSLFSFFSILFLFSTGSAPTVLRAILIYLYINALFAFPGKLAHTAYFGSVVIGGILTFLPGRSITIQERWIKVLVAVLAVFTSYFGVRYFYSHIG